MSAYSPAEIREVMSDIGEKKATNRAKNLIILGILAGSYIALGGELASLVMSDMSQYLGLGFTKFMGGFVFSIGLILVIVGGGELFTGNALIILAAMDKRISMRQLFRNWLIVYVSNCAGALIVVFLMYATGLWTVGSGLMGAQAVTIASGKVNLTIVQAVSRGILCNWLVCLAVWLAAAAKDISGKILAIIFPIIAFVASGFEHSVANMYFIPMGIVLKTQDVVLNALPAGMDLSGLTWMRFIVSLIPVTLGNIIGGAFFVGVLYRQAYGRGNTRKVAADKVEVL
jgi:formate/nitrite transporter